MLVRWLKCVVRKGMFSDELLVVIQTPGGDTSFFVPRERVDGQPEKEGKVQVRAYRENSRNWAVMPNDMQTIIPVDESQFAAA